MWRREGMLLGAVFSFSCGTAAFDCGVLRSKEHQFFFFLFHRIIIIIIIYVFCTVPSFVFAVFLFFFRLIVLRQRTVHHEFFFLVMVFLIHRCAFLFFFWSAASGYRDGYQSTFSFFFVSWLSSSFFFFDGRRWVGCTPMYESFIFICAFVSSTLWKGASVVGGWERCVSSFLYVYAEGLLLLKKKRMTAETLFWKRTCEHSILACWGAIYCHVKHFSN